MTVFFVMPNHCAAGSTVGGLYLSWDDGSTHHQENTRHSRAARPVARRYVAIPSCRRRGTHIFVSRIVLLIIGFTLSSGKRLMTNAVRRSRRSARIPAVTV